ncbi:MAG: hypothetical protein PHF67_02885 [Candidatus Nanoarchaeia archaeon]|nr:hypothetical protein [Candidatus Nanoarchaeia archaeon]
MVIPLILSSMAVVSAQTEYYDCPMGGMMYGLYGNYGSGFALLSWITFILFIGLIIAAIYWLIKSANKNK